MSTPLELEKELHLMTHERLREAEAKLTAATARAEKAERERDEKHHSFVRGARVAHELTHETQTAEDYAVDLVRQVKQARTERDALRAENERLRAIVDAAHAACQAEHMGARLACGQCHDSNRQHLDNALAHLRKAGTT